MPARRTIPRRPKDAPPDLPPSIKMSDPPPCAALDGDEHREDLWYGWLASHLPEADGMRVAFPAPGVTVADIIRDPTGFHTLVDIATGRCTCHPLPT